MRQSPPGSGSRLRVLWGASVLLFVSLLVPRAHAYCRTTTCDQHASCAQNPQECCVYDARGCEANGKPIAWPSSCVSFNIQEDGSPLLGISAGQLRELVNQAYDTWLAAPCAGQMSISLAMDDRGLAECSVPEFNVKPKDRSANIWMFNDSVRADLSSGMPIDVTALAITLVNFNTRTGELYDADVELFSGVANFTLDDFDVEIDLASVVLHEAGHFLGLDHSVQPSAVMFSRYLRGLVRRDLSFDDKQGICATYPPDRTITRTTCDPRGKYHTKCEGQGCDCRMNPGRSSGPSGAWLGLGLGVLFLLRRRGAGRGES